MSSKLKEVFKVLFDPKVHDPASVDNVPIEVPIELKEGPSLVQEIQRFVRIEMSRQASEQGFETFEEANDLEFSDDDDFDGSANELTEDQEMAMMSVVRRAREEGDQSGRETNAGVGQRSAADLAGSDDASESVQASDGEGSGRGSEGHLRGEGEVGRGFGKKISVNSEAAELLRERPSRRKPG